MGLLDDFLLGRNRDRRNLQQRQLDDLLNSRVRGISERGILVERPDTRASSIGAATALQATTGQIPAGFFNRVSDNFNDPNNSSLLAFEEDTGKDTFKRLTDAGIGVNSSAGDLYNALYGNNSNRNSAFNQRANNDRTSSRLQDTLRRLFTRQNGNRAGRPQPFGSTSRNNNRGSASISGDGFANPTGNFLDEFGLSDVQPNNTDFSTIGNYLDSLDDLAEPLLSGYLR